MELNPIQTMLEAQYNLSPSRIASQQGGWASLAYKIEMDDYRAYFLKVYDKKRASTPKLTANLNTYIPITLWLNAHTNLAGKIPVPLLSNNGGYVCEDEQGYYLLYPYIQGETIGEKKPGNDQIQQLAALIAELHRYGSEIPHAVSSLTENYKVPFLNELQEWITNVDKLPEGLREIVAAYELVVQEKINNLRRLSSRLQKCSLPMRLCHTDLHHWNLMLENDRLILIDWEGLKLAPVEADFMSLVDQPYIETFLSVYTKVHPGFVMNEEALAFYQTRRRLEDIWEFVEQLLFDTQSEQDREDSVNHLIRELQALNGE